MSRSGFQYALAALSSVEASAGQFDQNALSAITAGLNAAADVGRELTDLEQVALDGLLDRLAPSGEGVAVEGGEQSPPESESVTEAAPPVPDSGVSQSPAEEGPSTPPVSLDEPAIEPAEAQNEPAVEPFEAHDDGA